MAQAENQNPREKELVDIIIPLVSKIDVLTNIVQTQTTQVSELTKNVQELITWRAVKNRDDESVEHILEELLAEIKNKEEGLAKPTSTREILVLCVKNWAFWIFMLGLLLVAGKDVVIAGFKAIL